MQRRPERRMTGKRQLFRDREDADFVSFSGGIARQNESCLGKIHLTRERLHFVITQAARVSENGERITGQRRLGENIELNKFITTLCHKSYQIFSTSFFQARSQLSTTHRSKTASQLSFTEIVTKKGDADRIDRRAQTRRHYVYRYGGLQRARPTRRQSRSRAIGGTSPVVTRNLSAVSRHRNQNHRRCFPSRVRKRVGSGAMRDRNPADPGQTKSRRHVRSAHRT